MLQIAEWEIKAQLAKAQLWLAEGTDWGRLQAVGRCLHWLQDETAPQYFYRAVQAYPTPLRWTIRDYLTVGNLYRLAGAHNQAHTHFTHAYHQIPPILESEDLYDMQFAIMCYYFLGYDLEASTLTQRMQIINSQFETLALHVGRLAHARQTHDVTEAQSVAKAIATDIRTTRAWLASNGGPDLWDWYELAYQLVEELTEGNGNGDITSPLTAMSPVTWQAEQWVVIEENGGYQLFQADTAGDMVEGVFRRVHVFDTEARANAHITLLQVNYHMAHELDDEWNPAEMEQLQREIDALKQRSHKKEL
ncbi:MAG: hypothetical protein GFH27_549297n74 [Chloroflexi bacterium AL-W]|nr:hypothetical protein [Chloroflexi bacterium AL-N1]NOK68598.1 hypothetical protein [Chloroflexi bacterium AL-N10]NOK76084.1 hypothetical protein [Chloroflexi bacterium AL-N5]NOK82557.1 hypothetical protein [Chloroflexi bacterium AL-W]NOK93355.1 hypothetical protein [Chloroflexi bacterium AL-N15]